MPNPARRRAMSPRPGLPEDDQVIAILASDLHLSHRPPVFRSNEQDWYAAQARPLAELRGLQERYRCPVIVAGDIFDDGWRPHRCPAQLINFALGHLPDGAYAIPGQHDLPYHSYDALEKSAYWTLVRAGKIENIEPGVPLPLPGLVLHGFPWGFEVEPWVGGSVSPFGVRLAVIHAYIWTQETGYQGASEESRLGSWLECLSGYDASVFGDNHKGFLHTGNILNSGTFQRRKSDEKDYRPSVGLLYGDGRIERHYLDTSQDVTLTPEELVDKARDGVLNLQEFMSELEALGSSGLDFFEVLREVMRGAGSPVRKALIEILGREP